jgi:predicted membrane GTPase involved in stress response
VLVRLIPPPRLALDQALGLVREGEAVEVTPHAVRLRNRS